MKGLTEAQKNCFDPASAALFADVPEGLVMAPLFYGPTVLKLSRHEVVGGPYHRNGQAILDTIHATHEPACRGTDDHRRAQRRLCGRVHDLGGIGDRRSTRRRTGSVADLVAGRVPDWLQPVGAPREDRPEAVAGGAVMTVP